MPDQLLNIYFNEPLLRMNAAGRFAVRFTTYFAYGVMVAATVALFMSDISELRAAGWLVALFLGDRLLHIGEAGRSLARAPSGKVNVADYVSPAALAILDYARRRTAALSGNVYWHIFERLFARKDVVEIVRRLDAKPEEVLMNVLERIGRAQSGAKVAREEAVAKIQALVFSAFDIAQRSGEMFIEPRDLLAALAAVDDNDIKTIFELFGIAPQDVEIAVAFGVVTRSFAGLSILPATLSGLAIGKAFRARHRVMNRAWTARPTPTLDNFGDDLTDAARQEKIGFLIGHEAEYNRVVDVLSRPSYPNVLLIGEPGIGKETMIAHLAFQIAKDRVPAALFDKRLVSLQLSSLVAGADPAELRSRVQRIIDEVAMAGNVILYIPDIHLLTKTSGPQSLSLADLLMPAIKNDMFSVIGATYPKEYKQYVEPLSDFTEAFDAIRVEEISEAEAQRILTYQAIILEKQYRVTISFGAIKKAVSVAHKYLAATPLPSSAANLLKEALAVAAQRGAKILTPNDVVDIAEHKVNIPIHTAGKEEAEALLNLEQIIHKKYIDQDDAVGAVSRALREYRSGLSRKGGPMASFLFVGPTGVGKTELAKILAKIQFGSVEAMVRFDMSEYQDKQSFFRFIGSPDGNVSGTLTDAVLQKPYGIILLDEFEKAYSDILNLFLQVFDDGRLTDNLGRTVDFQNTIIIATSNAHSDYIKQQIEAGQAMTELSAELKKKLSDVYKPELLNRFSGIIVFRTLAPEHIAQIASLQLQDLAVAVKEAQGIDLAWDDAVTAEVARLGYDPVFGARPLRGVISDKLRSVLAEKILRGEVGRGDMVRVQLDGDQFVFDKSLSN